MSQSPERTKLTYWHCWVDTGAHYTSCLVRYDMPESRLETRMSEVIAEVETLARGQLPCEPEDVIESAPIPELADKETWHLCNLRD